MLNEAVSHQGKALLTKYLSDWTLTMVFNNSRALHIYVPFALTLMLDNQQPKIAILKPQYHVIVHDSKTKPVKVTSTMFLMTTCLGCPIVRQWNLDMERYGAGREGIRLHPSCHSGSRVNGPGSKRSRFAWAALVPWDLAEHERRALRLAFENKAKFVGRREAADNILCVASLPLSSLKAMSVYFE